MRSTSSPSEKMTSFSRGSWPWLSHQAMAVSAPSSGTPESMRMPVQEASHAGARFRNPLVP